MGSTKAPSAIICGTHVSTCPKNMGRACISFAEYIIYSWQNHFAKQSKTCCFISCLDEYNQSEEWKAVIYTTVSYWWNFMAAFHFGFPAFATAAFSSLEQLVIKCCSLTTRPKENAAAVNNFSQRETSVRFSASGNSDQTLGGKLQAWMMARLGEFDSLG